MRIQSPLSNLCEVLHQIKESANQYQKTLRKNEAATRAVLIDPVLRALGWDMANTNMVEVEKTLNQTRVDYALSDSTDVKIIIEAKSLGENLSHTNILMSLVTYAFTYKLQDIFLTDGLIWQHYTNFQPGNVAPTKTLNIVQDDPVECAAYFVQRLDAAKFWPEEQTIDRLTQRIDQLESAVSTLQQELIKIQTSSLISQKATNNSLRSAKDNGSNKNGEKFINLEDVTDTTGKKPIQLRLPNNAVIDIRTWKDILRECCKFALAHNPKIPIPFPDRSGKKVALFNTVKPSEGISFVTENYLGQQIFIYANYDSNHCIANALHVLKQVPSASQQVQAAVSF